jgi:hypothetical protein
VTAPARHAAARDLLATTTSVLSIEHWRRAVLIRREWMAHGLATAPADRIATEETLSRIYARHSRCRPRFHWVDSPRQALALLGGLPTHEVLHRWVTGRRPRGRPPLASDIAAGLSRLRSSLDECILWRDFDRPKRRRSGTGRARRAPELPPREALAAGVPLREVLRHSVRDAMETSLAGGFYLRVRAALAPHGSLPVAWYGQQESYWIAHYDVMRRLGLARYRPADANQLEDWAVLARSCGWWWPGEDSCVIVERPAAVRTEPVPGGWHEQVRLRPGRVPPIEYRDGWRPLPAPVGTPAPPRVRSHPREGTTVDGRPAHRAPAHRPPAHRAPADRTSADPAPADRAPDDRAPAEHPLAGRVAIR